MEQKQLDEIDESYFGEEFIDEEIRIEPVKPKKKKITKKRVSKISKSGVEFEMEGIKDIEVEELKLGKPKVEILEDENFSIRESSKIKRDSFLNKEVFRDEKVNPWEEKMVNSAGLKSAKVKKVETSPAVDPWDEEEESSSSSGFFKETSTWKAITGIILVLLVFSVFTQGFNFAEISSGPKEEIQLLEAEEIVLDYVNNNLLQSPFFAEVVDKSDAGSLFKISLSVGGQLFDSYVTKDGKLFFPQGFDTTMELPKLVDEIVLPEEVVAEEHVAEEHIAEEPAEVAVEEPVVKESVEIVVAEPVGKVTTVAVKAKKWLFTPHEIAVKKGDRVVLTIVPEGLDFTFAIPALGVEQEISGTTKVEFTATSSGSFDFTCSSCESYRGMTGILVVE